MIPHGLDSNFDRDLYRNRSSFDNHWVSKDDRLTVVRDLMNRVYRSLTRRLAKLFGEQLAAPMLE